MYCYFDLLIFYMYSIGFDSQKKKKLDGQVTHREGD